MKEYRVGILAYGFMGKAHTYGYQTLQLYYDDLPFKAAVHAVCTRDAAKGERLKETLDVSYATSSEDVIINDPEIDIIHITTPNSMHKDAIIKSIKAGKHIYCEKPMVLSTAEAEEVLGVMRQSNYSKTAQVVFHNRYFPTSLRARQLVEEDRIGRVFSFRFIYLHAGSSVRDRPATWRFLPEMSGMGALGDTGSHILDLLNNLVGFQEGHQFESVLAASQILFPRRPSIDGKSMVDIKLDDATYMILKLKNGATGTMECTKIATGASDELRFEIHGENGALAYNSTTPNFLGFYDATLPNSAKALGTERGWKQIECCQHYEAPGGSFPSARSSIGWLRGHAHSLYVFLNNVYHGQPGVPSLEDGAYIQHVLECAAQSAKDSRWVSI